MTNPKIGTHRKESSSFTSIKTVTWVSLAQRSPIVPRVRPEGGARWRTGRRTGQAHLGPGTVGSTRHTGLRPCGDGRVHIWVSETTHSAWDSHVPTAGVLWAKFRPRPTETVRPPITYSVSETSVKGDGPDRKGPEVRSVGLLVKINLYGLYEGSVVGGNLVV